MATNFNKFYIDFVSPWVDISHYPENKTPSNRKLVEETSDLELMHQHHANFNDDDFGALRNYSNDSTDTRDDILDNHKYGVPFRKPMRIERLDAAIAKNPLTKPLVTYSGISDQMHKQYNWTNHGGITVPTYTSTSLQKDVATMFCKGATQHVLEIHHGVGHTGAYLGSNSKATSNDEDEYLMPRMSHLVVDPTPRKEGDLVIWKARRV